MSNSETDGCLLGGLIVIRPIVSWLVSGYLVWNWLKPDSFGTAILFMITWSFIGKSLDLALEFIIAKIIR